MRSARLPVSFFLILAAASLALAAPPETILPQSTGTIRYLPFLGIKGAAPVGDSLQSTCFVTTANNLEWRRAFMEFSIPEFDKDVKEATLIITNTQSAVTSYPFAPDVHEVSSYPADLIIDASDYDASTALLGTLETDVNEGGIKPIEFDVTDLVRQSQGGNLGFRIKLQIDPAGCPTFAGSDFGGFFNYPPKLVIKAKGAPTDDPNDKPNKPGRRGDRTFSRSRAPRRP